MLANFSLDNSLTKAKSHIKKKEFLEAKKLYQEILNVFPKNVRAQKGLNTLESYVQNPPKEILDDLIKTYNKNNFLLVLTKAQDLTQLYPQSFTLYNLLGLAFYGLRNLSEALLAFNKAISIKPNYSEAIYNIGNIFQSENKLSEAIRYYDKAISFDPNHSNAIHKKGITLFKMGKFDQSIEAYKRCALLSPNYAEVYNNMGISLYNQNKLIEAIKFYDKSLSIRRNYPNALYNKSLALYDLGKKDAAINACKQAVELKYDYIEAQSKLGDFFQNQGNFDKALIAYKNAINIKNNHFQTYNNMAYVLHCQNKLEDSIACYKKAIFYNPDYAQAHQNLSYTLLNYGILKEGLDEYEWRWKTPKFLSQKRDFFQPKWDGKKSLKDKKILIWSEQGIGDTIRWSSVLPLVTSIAKSCILECQEKLVPLLKRSFPNVDVKAVDISNDLERTDFDFHLPMGSLYKCFLDEITKTPKPNSYLKADPDRVSFWRDRLNEVGKSPFYGISWKSSNMEPSRLKNYAPINEWSNLLKLPDTTFVNLQYKDFENDLKDIHDQFGVMVHNFDDLDHYNDIDDVAALCSALDAVISHNNTVHLISGAVGTETKLANWRQSSWNNFLFSPTTSVVDIFEKNTDEKWENIFSLIAKDLSKFNIN